MDPTIDPEEAPGFGARGATTSLTALGLNELLTPVRGRAKVPFSAVYIRDITEADIPELIAPPAAGTTVQPIKQLRARHHSAAILFAEGLKVADIAAITGYSSDRLYNLNLDPAFQELIAYYRTNKESRYLDVHARMAELGLSAAEELQRRIEDAPDSIGSEILRKIAEGALDRSGKIDAPGRPNGAPNLRVNVTFVAHKPATDEGPLIEGSVDRDDC